MRRPLAAATALAAAALAAAAPTSLAGQTLSSSCAAVVEAQDACQKAVDLFAQITPQLGLAVTGGNPTLGQGGNLGGFGRLSFGAKLTGVRGDLPRPEPVAVRLGPAQPSTFPVSDRWYPIPQVDAVIGLTRGFPFAISNIGGIDLLVSGSWLPSVSERDIDVRTTSGQFRMGAGVRLGILQESLDVPGVSVTLMRRQLPNVDMTGRAADDTLQVFAARVRSDSWRLVASRHRTAFGVAGGIGQDRVDARGSVSGIVNDGRVREAMVTPEPVRQRLTRTNAFGNLSINVGALRLVGEAGYSWGGDATTFNDFAGTSPTETRLYGSVGLRLGI